MKSKLARTLYWLSCNFVLVSLLYLAEFEQVSGAQNVLVFAVCVMFLLAAVGTTDEVTKDADVAARVRSNPIPVRIDVAFDALFLCTLIWFGWWLTGVAWLAHMMCIQVMRTKVAKLAVAQP